jgi:flagellar basal-body rod protein FlgB
MSMIDPVTLALVKSALDAGAMRQVAHANNVANASTAGYQPFHVVFEERLDAVREAVHEGRAQELNIADLPAAQLQVDESARAVSLDQEVAALSQNALQYQALTKALSRHYALLGMAVTDGRR